MAPDHVVHIEADIVVPAARSTHGDVFEYPGESSSEKSSGSTLHPNDCNNSDENMEHMNVIMLADAGLASLEITTEWVAPLQDIATSSPKVHAEISPKFAPSPSMRLSRKWLLRTFDDFKDSNRGDSGHDITSAAHQQHAGGRDAERHHHARFGFSGLALAAEGAASLASSQMSAFRKKVASGMRWLKHDTDGEDVHHLGSPAHAEENQHVVYGGTLTFPLVSLLG
jgi:hypothetical protein